MFGQGNGAADTARNTGRLRLAHGPTINAGREGDWLAGAGGFEPPHGGIKIRCLTTWLRPKSGAAVPIGCPAAGTILTLSSASNGRVLQVQIAAGKPCHG